MAFYGDEYEMKVPRSVPKTYYAVITAIKGSSDYKVTREDGSLHSILIKRGKSFFFNTGSNIMVYVGSDRENEGCSIISFSPMNAVMLGGSNSAKAKEDVENIKKIIYDWLRRH